MSKRVAKIEQRYAARTVTVGESFDVHPNDVRVLLALGRIEPIQGEDGYVEPPSLMQLSVLPADPVAPAVQAYLVEPVEPEVAMEPPKPEVVTKAAAIPRTKAGAKKKAD